MTTLTGPQGWGRESSQRHRAQQEQGTHIAQRALVLVHLLPAVLLVLWLNSGATDLVFSRIPGIYKWGLAVAWCGIAFLSRVFVANLARTALPLVLYIAYVVSVVNPVDPKQNAMLQNLGYLALAFSLFSFYSRSQGAKGRQVIAIAVLADILFVAVKTWRELDVTPQISRILATGLQYEDLRSMTAALWGVGGYAYAYSLPPILLVFSHRALTRPRGRWIYWTLVGAGTLLVIKMAFTIAILMWLASFGYLLLVHHLGERHRSAVPVLAAAGVAISVLAGPPILTVVAGAGILPDVINVRLLEVSDALSGAHNQQSDLGVRSEQYASSWNEFSASWATGSMGAGRGLGDTGGHSAWLDNLGTLGVAGFLLFWFLFLLYRRQARLITPSDGRVLNIAWVYFLTLGMINTVLFPQLLVVWFCIIPFMLRWSGGTSRSDSGERQS